MSDRLTVSRPLIDPMYSQANPNDPIDLGQVVVQFDHKGTTYQEKAKVTMRFVPDDRLEFACPLEGKPPLFGHMISLDNSWDHKLTLTNRGVTFDANCPRVEFGGMVFHPTNSTVTVTPPSNAISTATFHLFNFPDFHGPESYILTTGEPPLQGLRLCGRLVLKADGWSITVAATERTDSLAKALKAQGGYVITHVGRIVRDDGATYSSDQLDNLLNCLQYFLSFALGRWAGITLPIGFDAEGNRVFEQWGFRMTADGTWHGSCSWFDKHNGELLPQVFPGFISLWMNELWREPLTHALYWYLGACDRRVGIGVDTGLILAQTALELLAWTYCVQDRKTVSQAAFGPRGLSAAHRLRLLASALGISQEIPTDFSALHAKRGKKWADGLDAITTIRNSLVHPGVRMELPEDSYYEAWRLSLWYIDLILLRLCGHDGKYANRLAQRWTGQVESVPWAKKQADKESLLPKDDTPVSESKQAP